MTVSEFLKNATAVIQAPHVMAFYPESYPKLSVTVRTWPNYPATVIISERDSSELKFWEPVSLVEILSSVGAENFGLLYMASALKVAESINAIFEAEAMTYEKLGEIYEDFIEEAEFAVNGTV